jgi:RES domain-containing protein
MVCHYKGPLVAYRIADKRHTIFDGIGASLYGARWNSPGYPVIYAASTFAGAMLEKLAQSGRMSDIPKSQQFIKITIPKDVQIEEIEANDLPDWNLPGSMERKQYGDTWLQEKRTAILIMPSAVTLEEKNILINPMHAAFKKITASQPKDIIWDSRLFHPVN